MKDINEKIGLLDWRQVGSDLNEKGYALVDGFVSREICKELIALYQEESLFRKTVVMERYRFGLGEYKYFNYPLPPIIQTIRETIYPHLATIANEWMNLLCIDTRFPNHWKELQIVCRKNEQTKPTVLILKYGKGGFNTLHQDLYGDIFFPLQLVLFLNKPEVDYTGGEFVLTQSIPRAQSKAIVLKPNQGDMLIFTTNFKPQKGIKGYYRVQMKHGVSELHTGERHTLGIIFHDAVT
ncbi:2OG-Fe(II) oxygenase [Leptospira ilyithenensis]|uniref:Prolyl 4-hydroxylase subunit alpha n=1 Tax=Leptospira ilyithenensis TaxID=2484901 RepID=A0A4R9LRQ1_9LEPT|nr:2OG-Fe(II) oxygenase [Leptospira ilyithenensis]TGN11062.1 prolyl 4-hydroxylase subunit alpha [Leptospira ilyithenensis]